MITNKMGLPLPIVDAIGEERGYKEGRYSVTELLLPIREIALCRKYAGGIDKDASDMIPALFGTAVHEFLERHSEDREGLLREASFEAPVGGSVLSGRVDLYDVSAKEIVDYKTCSVSKIVKQDFEDWRMQGLMYAWLIWKSREEIVSKVRFVAMAKDWSKIKSATSANYPASAVYTYEFAVSDSDIDFVEKWIEERVGSANRAIETGVRPECTPEERWYTGDKWAVYKNAGDKRAAIVCDTEQEAHDYITNKCGGCGEIQFRKGESVKCRYYCDCCAFCKKGE